MAAYLREDIHSKLLVSVFLPLKPKNNVVARSSEPPASETTTNTHQDLFALFEDLSAMFDSHSPLLSMPGKRDLVVVFVTKSYLDTLTVWLHYYKQHYTPMSRRVLCIFAIDNAYDPIRKVLSSNQLGVMEGIGPVIVVKTELAVKLYEIWKMRLKLLQQLSAGLPNMNFLLSDTDALWLQDPQILMDQYNQSDAVASTGLSPTRCRLEGKRTACFGFVYFRNTQSFQELAQEMSARREEYADDQAALNCVLRRSAAYRKVLEEKRQDGSSVLVYEQPSKKDGLNFTISLLSDRQVIRKGCVKGVKRAGAVVAHCLAPKTGTRKMANLERFHLLPQDLKTLEWTSI